MGKWEISVAVKSYVGFNMIAILDRTHVFEWYQNIIKNRMMVSL